MSADGPSIIVWTDHAAAKAQLLGISRDDVEEAVLAGHKGRTRNTRTADWILHSRRLAIAYSFPVGDKLTALIVTLWRRG